MRLRHLTIAKKGLLILMLPLVYQAVLFGVLLKRQGDQVAAQQWVVHTKDVLGRLHRVYRALLEVQGSFRGFVLTGDPGFATDTHELAAQTPGLVTRLREITTDSSPIQQQRVRSIGETAHRRVAWILNVMSLLESGRKDEAMQLVQSGEGQKIMSSLDAEVDAFQEDAERLDQERLRALGVSTAIQDRLLIGGLVVSVMVAIGSALLFGANITRRVQNLARNASRFGRGEKLAPVSGGQDEIAELDRHFHEIAVGLEEARLREQAAQAALELRNTELEHVNRDLDHKNQENEMFVYSVSHDLRSPLVNLQGFSRELGLARDDLRTLFQKEWNDAVRDRANQVVDRDITESIHYIQTAVMRLSSIIDALLRLSRAGRVDYQPDTVDLQAVVQRIATSLRGSIQERGAQIIVGKLPPVWADPTAVDQIFANLLSNAVAYLDPARPGVVEAGFCETPPPGSDGLPTYYVKDNGLGIAEAYLPKVFAIFQRLHANVAKGEGVGLTLVRRMVERHGGRIWVESKPGEGTIFFVSFPPREESPLIVAPAKESTRFSSAAAGGAP